MEASRTATNQPTISMTLDPNVFSFAKKLKVGDKGIMKFNGIIKSHYAKQQQEEQETKTMQIHNLKQGSRRTQ